MKEIVYVLSLSILVWGMWSCGDSNAPKTVEVVEDETFELSPEAAILYDTVGAKHDTAMLLMGAIGKTQSKLRLQLKSMEEGDEKRAQVLDLLTALKKADDGMMNWMREFKSTELNDDEYKTMSNEEIMAYLKEEEKKIEQVHVDMLNSIAAGKAYLNVQS